MTGSWAFSIDRAGRPEMLAAIFGLDLAAVGRLEFEAPDLMRFPALRLAREVLQTGGGMPTILSAANEIAVEAFLQRSIGFLDISRTVEQVLQKLGTLKADTLDDVIALDATARRVAYDSLPIHTQSTHAHPVPKSSPVPAA